MIALSAIPTEEDRNKFREIYEENYLKMYQTPSRRLFCPWQKNLKNICTYLVVK